MKANGDYPGMNVKVNNYIFRTFSKIMARHK